MKKALATVFAICFCLFSVNLAHAGCTAPSGVFSGVANYIKYTGSAQVDNVNDVQLSASMTYSASSSSKPLSGTLKSLTYYNGITSGITGSSTISSSTFDTATCLGSMVMTDGAVYKIAVTGTGTEINFIITPPSTSIFYFVVQGALKKV